MSGKTSPINLNPDRMREMGGHIAAARLYPLNRENARQHQSANLSQFDQSRGQELRQSWLSTRSNGRLTMYFLAVLQLLSSPLSHRLGMWGTRLAIAVVFIWIGALKFVPYEADSITPFVANSPVMSFFYNHPKEYKAHLTKEGELKTSEREWQTANNTYGFSDGLGTLELLIGFLTLGGFVSTRIGLAGAFLAFCTPIVTLSFLITTPEAWVPALGDGAHGFPFLSGAGRLVLKDTVILGGSWLLMVDAARILLGRSLHSRIADLAWPALVSSGR